MKVKGEPSLIPQTEEDISQIKWVDSMALPDYLKNTYSTIIEIIKLFSSSQLP
jgi:hypothetical protein